MAISIVLHGTQGATDGTLDVQGDGNGLQLGAIGSVDTFFFKAPAGQTNDQTIVANTTDNCEISSDGVNYGASITIAPGIVTDKNDVAGHLRRTGGTSALKTTIAITGLDTSVQVPVAPVLLTPTISAITSSGAVVAFGATDANGDSLTYKVAVTTSPTAPTDWSGYADVASPYTASGLTALTDYYAHVRVSDGALTDVETSAKFTTAVYVDITAPTLTGTLTATPGDGQVTLDWPDATDNVAVTGYDVEYGTTTAYGSTIADPTTSTATITGLTNGTLYYFRARAHDAAGNVSNWLTASATMNFFADNFDRADSLTVGNGWTQAQSDGITAPGVYGIKSSSLYVKNTTSAQSYMTIARTTDLPSNRSVGLTYGMNYSYLYLGRTLPSPSTSLLYDGNGYVAVLTATLVLLRRLDGGTYTALGTFGTANTAGDAFVVSRSGNDVFVTKNGVEVIRATDSTYLTLPYVGCGVGSSSTLDSEGAADNFTAA